jgi:hypothetical protein
VNEGELQALAGLRQRSREQYEAAQGQPDADDAAPEAAATDFDAGARQTAPTPVSEAATLLAVLDRHHSRRATAPPFEAE